VSPILILALATGGAAAVAMIAGLRKPAPPSPESPAPTSKAAPHMAINVSTIETEIATARTALIGYLATDPRAIAAVSDLVSAIESKIQGDTTNPIAQRLEVLAFSVVNSKLKAMAGVPSTPASPGTPTA
jgi:hypothetical protein